VVVTQRKRALADVPPGSEDPISFAVSQRDKTTLAMVREAISHQQTLLAYQPVMRADVSRVGFYEGLIRILDVTGRVIPASDFIDVVEDTETGREIDVLALRMGLQTLRENRGLRLSINMSARSIGYQPWSRTLRRALNLDATIGERLILEITERSAMTVPELVAPFMADLQRHGVCFAMDDFGAGQTALRYFKDFDFDMIKIDGEFIRGIAETPDNRVLTAALVSIARHFDMVTVAESVENAADAEVLVKMGVDCLQGHLFAAPTTRPHWSRETT